MITALINWLGVHEDENLPDDLKLSRLDRLDGITSTRPTGAEADLAA